MTDYSDFDAGQCRALIRLVAKPDSYLETYMSRLEKYDDDKIVFFSGEIFRASRLAEFIYDELNERYTPALP